jgi:O-antigen/teichoic acid export membrane protein
MALLVNLKNKFLIGHERTIKAKKNILALTILNGLNVLVNLAIIPLTLGLLDEYKFGVWITLFNVLSWISIFDIGIGNGLRNKYTECIAQNNISDAKKYVSTAYFLVTGISFILMGIFLIPWLLINWSFIFNVSNSLSLELFYLVGITFFATCVQFVLKLITILLVANHEPYISTLINLISNVIIYLTLLYFNKILNGSLVQVGVIFVSIPLVVYSLFSFGLFKNRFKLTAPSIKFFDKRKVKSLFSLGIQFFIIQIAVIVIFSTDSMIITHVLTPKDVTSYNIVFRYFGIVTMAAGIIMTPFWSSYTDAASKNDYKWIKSVINKQIKAMIYVFIILLALILLSRWIIPIWLQKTISLSPILVIGMAGFVMISIWNNIFSFLLNGLSITKVQTYTSIIGILVNIPLSYFLAKVLGNGGVIIGTVISLSFFAIFGPRNAIKYLKSK